MWTVAGCGFCLHFVPGSDSPFLWHGDGPVETEHCHPLALLLREEHDGQNIRPCLYPRCVVYPFSFSQAGVLPYAPPVWHRRSWPRRRSVPSSRPRRISSFGADFTRSFKVCRVCGFSLIFPMYHHLNSVGGAEAPPGLIIQSDRRAWWSSIGRAAYAWGNCP